MAKNKLGSKSDTELNSDASKHLAAYVVCGILFDDNVSEPRRGSGLLKVKVVPVVKSVESCSTQLTCHRRKDPQSTGIY